MAQSNPASPPVFSSSQDAYILKMVCSTMVIRQIVREIHYAAKSWGCSAEDVSARAGVLVDQLNEARIYKHAGVA